MKILRNICAITLGGIIILGSVSLANSGTVNAPNGLVLRKEASKNGEPIATINDKSNVEIIEKSGEWYKVKYNGQEGYIFSEYVNIEKESSESKNKESNNTDNASEGKETNGKEESKTTNKKKAKENLKIYSIPSITAKTIADVKKDEEININYELNDWLNITYGKTQGWVRKYFIEGESVNIKEESNSEETKQEEQKTEEKIQQEDSADKTKEEKESQTKQEETNIIENKKGYIDANDVNIREKASTSSNVVNTLLKNTEVTITGEEGDFYKIQYQDITGYIAKQLISGKPVQ